MSSERVLLVDGARTPIGSFGGVFKDVPAHELGAAAAREAMPRAGVRPEGIDEVVMGCVGQAGADAPFHEIHMGVTAENVARKYGVSRQAQDEFALESQRRAASDPAAAAFAEEITAIEVDGRKAFTVEQDEHPKPGTTLESLAGLRPAFEREGTVTAGNASGINDGAAVVVLAREPVADERGLTGLVTLEDVATAAMEPELMGYAPVLALQKLFSMTGTAPSDIDIVELNEAFAAQAVAVIRDARLDPEKTNPYGGAIALGHPVGVTGAMLSLRVAKHLARADGELGIVTMCIGGGQALAALFRRA